MNVVAKEVLGSIDGQALYGLELVDRLPSTSMYHMSCEGDL